MPDIEADKQTATDTPVDRGELTNAFAPLCLGTASRQRQELTDIALDLAGRAAGFKRSLPSGTLAALSEIVRSMNCYYSNLIEGHDTHPIDIERALNGDYSTDTRQRNLQCEARVHIKVQQWIDEGGLQGRATSVDGLLELHRRFYEQLPEDLRWIENLDGQAKTYVEAGQLRSRDVRVGYHIAISPGALPRFLKRFDAVYSALGRTDRILAIAAAHHRLLWIHPFLDGNGRVARLMSHAIVLEVLDTDGLWSIARGLARREADYKQLLAACDQPRRNDLDGRGMLSEEALAAFSRFFLELCVDQVDFMERLMEPSRLRERILHWAGHEISSGLPPKARTVLEVLLYRGELTRGEVPALLDLSERQARRVVAELLAREAITSTGRRAPLRLHFSARLGAWWMPGLFPGRRT
ncbi:MAG: Fic family protein [Gammaproteobacteria bacterium]|nr:Fic family protein [Gammaproteobacteria bacterium]